MGSEFLHFFDKLEYVIGKQLGLLKCSKVTPSRHECVGVDVLVSILCPRLWAVHQLCREGSEASGYKYPSPRVKDNTFR